MLELTQLTKTYPSQLTQRNEPALKGVSFSVREGEFFTLLGPSGCGKTTTLQCIAGLEDPDTGNIRIGDDTVFDHASGTCVPANKRGLGMVFQSYAIWPHMTVVENVAFPLVHGTARERGAAARRRALQALEMVELGHLADRPAPLLSGGQQQRVALARALVHEPRLLLLDEPLSNLDARLRETMRIELRNLVKKLGTTTIFVTHDQVEAVGMSDTIVLMRDGNIIQSGSPRDICMRPNDVFVAEFIGQNNLLPATLRGDHAQTAIGALRCVANDDVAEGSAAVLVIHPRAILAHDAQPAADDNLLDAVVDDAVFLGDQLDVSLRVGDTVLRAAFSPFTALARGDRLSIRIPASLCTMVRDDPSRQGAEPRGGVS